MGIEGLHSLFSPSFEPLTDCSFDFLPMPLQCPFVASLVLSTSRRVCAVLLANRLFLVLPSSYLITLYLLLPRSVGWRIVRGEVVNKNSHPAIVDTQLFEFAFTTLTGMNLDGNVLELPKKRGRYYQRTRDERKSLLKDRIQGAEGQVSCRTEPSTRR